MTKCQNLARERNACCYQSRREVQASPDAAERREGLESGPEDIKVHGISTTHTTTAEGPSY